MCVSYYTDPKNRVGRDIKHFILSEYFVAPKLRVGTNVKNIFSLAR